MDVARRISRRAQANPAARFEFVTARPQRFHRNTQERCDMRCHAMARGPVMDYVVDGAMGDRQFPGKRSLSFAEPP